MAAHEYRNPAELTAVLLCPNRQLADEFETALPDKLAVTIVADVKEYPSPQDLDARLRQLRPDVVFLDLSANVDTAVELIGVIAAARPKIHVVGLHSSSDAGIVIRSLRAGATEFLCSPFDLESLTTVITRILRLLDSEDKVSPALGKLYAFTGAKAGQGATTIATNVAFVASELGKRRVLLVDLDLAGGTISFALRLSHPYNVLDAIRHSEKIDKALWSALVSTREGVDVLLAPERPERVNIDGHRVGGVFDYARANYDIIIADLPAVYERVAEAVLADTDGVFLVSNPELSSLHLTRKCLVHLEQLSGARDQYSVLVNRMQRRDELTSQDIEKVFEVPIEFVFPEDRAAAHRALTAGKPIPPNGELGRALRSFGMTHFGNLEEVKKKGVGALAAPALSSNG